MIYRQLGRSGLEVSVVSFGCMSLGDDHAVNERLIHRALELGVNYFDTADLYQHGENEASVGKALQGRRHSIFLATKVGNRWRPDGSGWDWDPSRSHIERAVQDSLRRLRTDYIDVYQLHGGTIEDPIDEAIEAFEALRQAGAIRHYGISSIRPNVIAEWVKRSGLASVMMQYSLLDRRPEESGLDLLREHDVGVVVRGGLAKGLLAAKPSALYLDHSEVDIAAAQRLLGSVAGDAAPAHVALRYCLAHPGVTTVACGIRTMAQLEENVAATTLPPLAAADLETLRAGVRAYRYEAHR